MCGGRLAGSSGGSTTSSTRSRARTAGEAMTAPALTVRPADQTHEAARLMVLHRSTGCRSQSKGKLVGIVTRADLVRAFHRTDEEIADEIRDEILRDALWIETRSDRRGSMWSTTGDRRSPEGPRRRATSSSRPSGVGLRRGPALVDRPNGGASSSSSRAERR